MFQVCQEYLKDTNMLFIGGLLMAIAIENWQLHKRIALRVLLITGVRPALLLMGFMIVTAFLSMWISNTATTAMMVPIGQAVLEQLQKSEAESSTAGQVSENINKAFELQEEATKPESSKETEKKDVGNSHVLTVEEDKKRNENLLDEKHKQFSKGMSLCICYSASIGGIATLTGTTPNLILQGQVADFRKNFGCAASASEKAKEQHAYNIIKEESNKLGSMKFPEIAVLILFVLLVLLWFTRDPGFIPGSKSNIRAPPALLDWKTVQQKMPWNIVFLLGGGFALAKGSEESGLSSWLGSKLTPLQQIPHPAIALLLCLLVAMFTECTSNVATTTLFLPILASMAEAICLNPLYVMLPCTLSASLAFMLPVATPPNAIVFSYGQLKVIDMAKAGFMLNILGVLTISLALNTWTSSLFQLQTFPSWANKTAVKRQAHSVEKDKPPTSKIIQLTAAIKLPKSAV
ncbi:solute carrier family 13 member 2 isoform B [Patagioenas fasciata monilis]|uniref:Solute carrier family 13 member 2 isoform B n=1 Tax=Patagioenas fasciata monilis TaxID=372326 RepID=A0A1V4K428_PATFA|nr:solute carrier family 13 member 2 isoform B [Patagioenas fasciata monilis]